MGDRGKGEYGRISAHPEPSPGDPLVSFPSLGKKLAACTAPAGAFRSATAAKRRLLARRWRRNPLKMEQNPRKEVAPCPQRKN